MDATLPQLLHHYRFIPVVLLLALAAALLRRKDQPPLALKGLQRVLTGGKAPPQPALPAWRRLAALACVLAALLLALA